MRHARVGSLIIVVAGILGFLFVIGGGVAFATAAGKPGFAIDSLALPTDFSQADGGAYQVTVRNAGSIASSGEIFIADTLPTEVTAQSIEFYRGIGSTFDLGPFLCDVGSVMCRFPAPVAPDEPLKMIVHVAVGANAPEVLVNKASVAGGGSPTASVEAQNAFSAVPTVFGPASFSFAISGPDGMPENAAGGHPYEMTVTFGLNNGLRTLGPLAGPSDSSVQDVKDVIIDLPLGFVASTLATPQCTLAQLSSGNGCPPDTIVGHIYSEPSTVSVNSPIYNLVPERGVPGEFGFFDSLDGAHVFYAHVVPTPSGYVVQTVSPDLPEVSLTRVVATLYGDPAEKQKELAELEGKSASPIPPVPYFTNPTDCSDEPMVATIYMDSWENPAKMNQDGTAVDLSEQQWAKMQSSSPPVIGCDGLQFPVEFGAQPTTHEADKPSGLDSEIEIAQTETIGVPATPTMRKAVVTLPEGFTVDPSAGGGLAACSEAQIGWEEARQGPMKFNAAAPQCPEASKIGVLELESPLIGHRLEGEMFLASQNENPFHSTLATYVVVNDPVTGVVLKVAGKYKPVSRRAGSRRGSKKTRTCPSAI